MKKYQLPHPHIFAHHAAHVMVRLLNIFSNTYHSDRKVKARFCALQAFCKLFSIYPSGDIGDYDANRL